MRNFFTFLLISVFISCASLAQETRSTTFDNREICEQSKGVWRQFGNGCAGSCAAKFEKYKVCTMAITFGCDCGVDRCWDGKNNNCVSLDDYKVVFDKNHEELQKKLDEMKEARKQQAKENTERIMSNLMKNYNSQVASENDVSVKSLNNSVPQSNLNQFHSSKSGGLMSVMVDNQSNSQQNNIVQNTINEVKTSLNQDQDSTQNKFEIPISYLQKLQQKQAQDQQTNQPTDVTKSPESSDFKEKKSTFNGFDEGLPQIPLPN